MPVRGGVCVVSALLLVATLTTCAEFSQLEEEDVSVPTRGFTPDDLPEINLNLTAVKHHAGEAAVGATAGALGAWVVHRLQSTALLVGILGSVGTAAALHLKWLSPEQVRAASPFYLRVCVCSQSSAIAHACCRGRRTLAVLMV